MKRLRWILACGGVLMLACTARFIRPVDKAPFPSTPERLARGEYLVRSVAACGACHGARLSGSWLEEEPAETPLSGGNTIADEGARLWVPNITSDPETGLGTWSDDEVMRAIRDGIRPDGKLLFPAMPFNDFQHLSDEDARSIVVYLRSLPPTRAPAAREANVIPFFARFFLLKVGVAHHAPVHDIPAPPADPQSQGAYLVSVAGCTYCHSRTARGDPREAGDPLFMAGSEAPFDDPRLGKVWAANLTPCPDTGLGRFSEEQVKQAIRTGIRLDGKTMAPPMFAFRQHYSGMTDEDLTAVVAFLRALPPSKNKVPERQLVPEMKARVGED